MTNATVGQNIRLGGVILFISLSTGWFATVAIRQPCDAISVAILLLGALGLMYLIGRGYRWVLGGGK